MKTCFKCKSVLPISEYYKHPMMADGHLGKCKSCTRKDSENRRKLKESTDLDWVIAERERHRKKTQRARANGTVSKVVNKTEVCRRYSAKFPLKRSAQIAASKAIRGGKLDRKPCEKCGKSAQAHHEDYTKPLEVVWLCSKHHSELHVRKREEEIVRKFQLKS